MSTAPRSTGAARIGGAAAMLLAVLLAGCATAPRPVPDDRAAAWSQLQGRLQALSAWRAEGRLTVRTPGDVGNAHFTWIEQAGGAFRLRLGGPLGQGGGRLTGGGDGATLVTADGRRYAGRDAAALLHDLYGWRIPVAGLRRWLLGLPGEEAQFRLDRFGRLATLDWRGWDIEYRRHRNVGDLDLPATLLARDASAGTEIRIAIDHWDLGGGDNNNEAAPGSPVPLIGG